MKLYRHSTRNGMQQPFGTAFFVEDNTPEEIWRPLFEADKLKSLGPFYVCHKCRAVVITWESVVAPASATVITEGKQTQVFTCPACAGTKAAAKRVEAVKTVTPPAKKKTPPGPQRNDSLFGA